MAKQVMLRQQVSRHITPALQIYAGYSQDKEETMYKP